MSNSIVNSFKADSQGNATISYDPINKNISFKLEYIQVQTAIRMEPLAVNYRKIIQNEL